MGEGKAVERGEQSGAKATHGRVETGGWRKQGEVGAFAGDSPDIGCGSDLGILTMCIGGGQQGEETLILGDAGIYVYGRDSG